ncbi:MAG TPA: hypothetical protein PKD55_23485 [Bellilinea sp.]|mgnify:CR=1 FL=1|nr:hypothetical protein [Bellilinea sp.]
MRSVAEERRLKFLAEYEDPYADRIGGLIEDATWMISFVFGHNPDADGIEDGLQEFARRTFGANLEKIVYWWENLSIEEKQDLPLLKIFSCLHAEAYYGVILDQNTLLVDSDNTRDEAIPHTFLNLFLHICPPSWPPRQTLERAIRTSHVRFYLDHAEHADTPEAQHLLDADDIAAISGLNLKTVKNALAPGNRAGLTASAEGKASAYVVRRWLIARNRFLPSVWTLRPDSDGPTRKHSAAQEVIKEPVFVPIARDGSFFSLAAKRNGVFTIGPKGDECEVNDFWNAVEKLQHMPIPAWRRPNKKGNWGIVSAIGWARKTPAELGL